MNTDYAEEREPLDTKNMLETAFFENLKNGPTPRKAVKEVPKLEVTVKTENDVSTEELLTELFDVRDGLIDSFENVDIASPIANNITAIINNLGQFITRVGGKAEHFDPLAHVSGLQNPNLVKNAQRVIENTRDSYSGEVEEAHVNDKEILIAFGGKKGKVAYKAIGTVSSNGVWIGNEAIDYVYTPGEGKMSVKALNEHGQWIDKSDHYKISWVLEESDLSDNAEAPKESEKKIENIEEEEIETGNNVTEEEIFTDFTIEES